MSLTSKSPRRVILTALAVGREALPEYAHRCSPKTYTLPQLFACLVLKTFLRTDYRGVEVILRDLPGLGDAIGLKCIPDHSTLHKAAKRLFGSRVTEAILAASIRLSMGRRKKIKLAAADSSGLESGHRSPYFVRRRARGQKEAKNPLYQTATYTRFPKLSLLIDCETHMVLSLLTGSGPSPDMHDLPGLLAGMPKGLTIATLLADAGFDSQENHEYLREEHGILSIIPPKIGRPTQKPFTGEYRELMRWRWSHYQAKYGQRWQVETVNSMIKRNLTDELMACGYQARCREMRLLAIAHNIMILWRKLRFSTEQMRFVFWRVTNPRSLGICLHWHRSRAPRIYATWRPARDQIPTSPHARATTPTGRRDPSDRRGAIHSKHAEFRLRGHLKYLSTIAKTP